jgi:hypothetical protein
VPHDSRNASWALEAAEKLTVTPSCACFVAGHDFSRAATALKSTPGFSPCYDLFQRLLEFGSFSAACLAPEGMHLNHLHSLGG